MIKVVNGRTEGFIGENKIYIGRANSYKNLKASPIANPFCIGKDGDRNLVVVKYKSWFYHQLATNPEVVKEVNRIYNLARTSKVELVCWCAPQACHGDIVKEYLDNCLTRNQRVF